MKFKEEYLFCSPRLLHNVDEVHEIFSCIDSVKWKPEFEIQQSDIKYQNQTGYNKAFDAEFFKYNWQPQPTLCENPKLIGDYSHSALNNPIGIQRLIERSPQRTQRAQRFAATLCVLCDLCGLFYCFLSGEI